MDQNYEVTNFSQEALAKTRSSLLNKELLAKRPDFASSSTLLLLFIAFFLLIAFVVFARSFAQMSEATGALFISIGAIFAIYGLKRFSSLQQIESIPVAQIGAAAEGLNEIQGTFVVEEGEPLLSPMTKKRCILYQVSLDELVTSRSSSTWVPISEFSDSKPSLLSDNTGYLALDLADANIDSTSIPGVRQYIVDAQGNALGIESPEVKALQDYMQTSPTGFDLGSKGIFLTDLYKNKLDLLGPCLSLHESTIVTDQTVFAIGQVSGELGRFGGRNVRAMVYDPKTKVFNVSMRSKKQLELKTQLGIYLPLAFGALMLIWGVYLLFNLSKLLPI